MKKQKESLKIIPIGGLHEIGKNMTLLQYGNDILIIDCGMSFPDEQMFGIDAVIPDFTYLTENADKVRGLIVTHAHEDHIGGIPYLLQNLRIPVYASGLTIGFIRRKLEERNIKKPKLHEIKPGDTIKLGAFKVEAIHTTHSVADSFAFAIDTPVGKLVHTGDFKVDYTPVDGAPIDLARFAELGKEGVQILLADSTNAARKGYTPSEQVVGDSLRNIFSNIDGRIIIATFSSNVHRVQKIIDIAVDTGRKVAISGRSMEQMVAIAKDLGYLTIPANTLVDLKKIKNVNNSQLVVITTGSQGEPMSALYRMASGEHRDVKIRKGDTIILSSTPVPGNEKSVSNVVNQLFELGAQVIYNDIAETHVSGHACEEELKLIHALLKPKFFMPVHGEARHLKAHEDIAVRLGMNPDRIISAENGDIIELRADTYKFSDVKASAEAVMVDGLGVGDVGNVVLRERKDLSEGGCLMIAATLDKETGRLLAGPSISTRGLIYVKEYGELLEDAEHFAQRVLKQTARKTLKNELEVKKLLREKMRSFILERTGRSPVIISIIMYV
ncbi:MAG: ribonuclease J [Firmicutes bacterium]|nr:ribonuclease J [Bacillota bacterium]